MVLLLRGVVRNTKDRDAAAQEEDPDDRGDRPLGVLDPKPVQAPADLLSIVGQADGLELELGPLLVLCLLQGRESLERGVPPLPGKP